MIHSSKIVFYSLLRSEALNSKNKEHVNDQQRPCVEPTCGIVANYPHSSSSNRQRGEPKLSYGVKSSTIISRCKREDLIKKFLLALRGLALIFSVIALIIMAINKHSEFCFHYEYDSWEIIRTLLKMVVDEISTNMENIGGAIHAILNKFLRFSVSC